MALDFRAPIVPTVLRVRDLQTGKDLTQGDGSLPTPSIFDKVAAANLARAMSMPRAGQRLSPAMRDARMAQPATPPAPVAPAAPSAPMGFFDRLPSPMSPAGRGLGAAAATLLQASGYSPTPVTLGQALGAAGAAGMEAMTAAEAAQQDRAYNQMMLELKMREALRPDRTTLEENLIAAGYTPNTPEYAAAARAYLMKSNVPDLVGAEMAKAAVDRLQKDRDNIRESQGQYDAFVQMDQILQDPDFETGLGSEAYLSFLRIGQAFGVTTPEEQEDFNRLQYFESLSNKLTPLMRPPGSGSTSDFEVTMFKAAAPSLAKDARTNRILVKGAIQTFRYNEAKLNFMEDYLAENQSLRGAGEAWAATGIKAFQTVDGTGREADMNLYNMYKSGKIQSGDVFMTGRDNGFVYLTPDMITNLESRYG